MAKMKGATLIAEFLVKEKIPYVFGISGHGNVGLLDRLYQVRDQQFFKRGIQNEKQSKAEGADPQRGRSALAGIPRPFRRGAA